jgi:hypothetical protein
MACTFNEFKNWLEGVIDMQENPTDWSPSRVQWIKILEKINSIEESKAVQIVPASHPPTQYEYFPPVVPHREWPDQQAPVATPYYMEQNLIRTPSALDIPSDPHHVPTGSAGGIKFGE